MQTVFWASYLLLWGLATVAALVLRDVVRQAVWLKRLYLVPVRSKDVEGLTSGTPAPDFSGLLLGSNMVLSKGDLKGDPSILLFVAPKDSHLLGYQKLSIALHTLWHRVEGRLFVVCAGMEEECRKLAVNLCGDESLERKLPVVIDREARIAINFGVKSTPAAVELGEDLLVNRYGYPSIHYQSTKDS
jgi:hypothetical protein